MEEMKDTEAPTTCTMLSKYSDEEEKYTEFDDNAIIVVLTKFTFYQILEGQFVGVKNIACSNM